MWVIFAHLDLDSESGFVSTELIESRFGSVSVGSGSGTGLEQHRFRTGINLFLPCLPCVPCSESLYEGIVWETMQFCNVECLAQYQAGMSRYRTYLHPCRFSSLLDIELKTLHCPVTKKGGHEWYPIYLPVLVLPSSTFPQLLNLKKTLLSCVRTFRCMGWNQEASAARNGGSVDEDKTKD